MRHKYETSALVLARAPLGEANTLLTLLTEDVGLVRARAQGLRKSSSKLAAALTTLSESKITLVRGAEGWRLSGAVSACAWFPLLPFAARTRAMRVLDLLIRLMPEDTPEPRLAAVVAGFLEVLTNRPVEEHDSAECLAVLRILGILGLDAGDLPEEGFGAATLAGVLSNRSLYVSRINRGIASSGL